MELRPIDVRERKIFCKRKINVKWISFGLLIFCWDHKVSVLYDYLNSPYIETCLSCHQARALVFTIFLQVILCSCVHWGGACWKEIFHHEGWPQTPSYKRHRKKKKEGTLLFRRGCWSKASQWRACGSLQSCRCPVSALRSDLQGTVIPPHIPLTFMKKSINQTNLHYISNLGEVHS